MQKDVSIVLGAYNRKCFLKLTIDSVRDELKNSNLDYEIIVVDGGSTDGSLQWLTRQKDILTIVQHNRGTWRGKHIKRKSWGYFMNLGFKSAQGKYICMLSDDCLIVPGAIRNAITLFENKLKTRQKIGAMAFYWRNWPEQQKYWVGLTLGNNMFVNHGLYLKSALANVGYIDEDSYIFYHADGDLCLKLHQKGYACIDSPESYIEHYSQANIAVRKTNSLTQAKDWEKYTSKWGQFAGGWLEKDFLDELNTADRFKYLYSLDRIKRIIMDCNIFVKLWKLIMKYTKIIRNIICGIRAIVLKLKTVFSKLIDDYEYHKKWVVFKKDFKRKRKQIRDNRFTCSWQDRYPCLFDNTTNTEFDAHYIYHTAWAARVLAETKPQKHVDIGSSLYFVNQVSAFIPIDFYDYRPAKLNLSGLSCDFADVTKLPFADNSVESLSCMHVVEHIGLERYGDKFDPQGDLKAMRELQRVLKQGGELLFVVPVGGKMRIQYNAHRIYTYSSICEYFSGCTLKQFALVTDQGKFLPEADEKNANEQNYGCGCFLLRKKGE
jgi:glycosyltransferase involved in cell wall biosynthesis